MVKKKKKKKKKKEKDKEKKKERRRKRCEFSLLNTLSAVHWQFLLLPPVKYKSRCFLNISSNSVHVPIVALTDCVHVIILLNSINQLGSVIGIQHVYCKVRTALLYTQINFRFPKGQLIRYRDIFGLVSPSVRNHSAIPTKYTKTLHNRQKSFIHSSSSITVMQIHFQYKTDHLYVAHLMTFISSSGCAVPCERMVSE